MDVRTNRTQYKTLLEFMERHGDILKYCPAKRLKTESLWQHLTCTLNSLGSLPKTTEKWKKVWGDWKIKTKRKIASQKELTTFEKRVFSVMSHEAIKPTVIIEPFSPLSKVPQPVQFEEVLASPPEDSSFTNVTGLRKSTPKHFESITVSSGPPLRVQRKQMRVRRLVSATTAIELKRLRLEEVRENNYHEREMKRIDLDREHNKLLQQIMDTAKAFLDLQNHKRVNNVNNSRIHKNFANDKCKNESDSDPLED